MKILPSIIGLSLLAMPLLQAGSLPKHTPASAAPTQTQRVFETRPEAAKHMATQTGKQQRTVACAERSDAQCQVHCRATDRTEVPQATTEAAQAAAPHHP